MLGWGGDYNHSLVTCYGPREIAFLRLLLMDCPNLTNFDSAELLVPEAIGRVRGKGPWVE